MNSKSYTTKTPKTAKIFKGYINSTSGFQFFTALKNHVKCGNPVSTQIEKKWKLQEI